MYPVEVDMLATLAAAAGLDGSNIVRLLIREAYALKYGEKKPKPRAAAHAAPKGGE
jgi:predicted DsbA family dithiol-disulfide isomerase